jgi:hypothetical protein
MVAIKPVMRSDLFGEIKGPAGPSKKMLEAIKSPGQYG